MNTTPKTVTTQFIETPGGSVYYIPIVEQSLLPIKGSVYETLEKCIDMYQRYGFNAGFDIRKSTQKRTRSGIIKQKYLWCNRSGIPNDIYIDTLNKEDRDKLVRKSNLERTGCRACVRFDLVPGTTKFVLSDFQEKHNHMLIPEEYRHLTKKARQLKYAEQLFIVNASNSNIGPTKAHQLYSNMKGSEKDVNGTTDDFRNWKRDINCFIGDSDSQMIVNKMENRKKYVSQFSFEYKIEDSELHSIFWADEVAKCNYKEFGDIISFDATYRTNM